MRGRGRCYALEKRNKSRRAGPDAVQVQKGVGIEGYGRHTKT